MVNRSTSAPSPPSPTPWTADAFVWWRSLLVAAALAGGAVLIALLQAAWILGTHARVDMAHLRLDWTLVVLQLASYAPIVPILFAVLPWAARVPLHELGLRRPSRGEALQGLAGGGVMLVVMLALGGLQTVVTHLPPQEQAVNLLAGARDPLLIAAFAVIACGFAPFAEELVFRGYVLNALRRYLPLWLAAVLSGLVFGAVHGSPTALVPLWGGGIVLAYVYARTGTLAASMISHAAFNVVNVALIVFAHQT